MNTKQLTIEKSLETQNNTDFNVEIANIKTSDRVDINKLMLKVRKEKEQEKKENLIFVGLVSSVVLITGLLASL
jgi:hypothetical protein